MICCIESVDPVADFCLTNQIYSELLNANSKKSLRCKIITLKCFSKIAKRELVDARPSNAQKCCLKIAKLEDDETRPRGCK